MVGISPNSHQPSHEYFCPSLSPVVFFPTYKDGSHYNTSKHIEICGRLGAEVRLLENPTQLSVNWYRANKIVKEEYGNTGVLLPQGLPFDETVTDLAHEIESIPTSAIGGTLVIAVGSGTMAAGVISGLMEKGIRQKVVGVLVSPKPVPGMWHIIMGKAHQATATGIKKVTWCREYLSLVPALWEYHDVPRGTDCPFPCNPYYDLKAWAWLRKHLHSQKEPVLFWNIGA